MTPRDFCFWLAGILKMSKDDSPTDKLIREQLDEVIKRQRATETHAWDWSNKIMPCSEEGTVPIKSNAPLSFDERTHGPLHPLPGINVNTLPS